MKTLGWMMWYLTAPLPAGAVALFSRVDLQIHCKVAVGVQPVLLAADCAGFAINVLHHLIKKFPWQGYYLTNKPPAVKQNGGFGLLAFGQSA
jgi:hypothetical protein